MWDGIRYQTISRLPAGTKQCPGVSICTRAEGTDAVFSGTGGVLLPASDNRPSFSTSLSGCGPGQRATLAAKRAQLCSALYSCRAQTEVALPLHLPIHVIKLSKDLYTKTCWIFTEMLCSRCRKEILSSGVSIH